MNHWQPAEPWCQYVFRRRQRRVVWIQEALAQAQNETALQLALRLAQHWRIAVPAPARERKAA